MVRGILPNHSNCPFNVLYDLSPSAKKHAYNERTGS